MTTPNAVDPLFFTVSETSSLAVGGSVFKSSSDSLRVTLSENNVQNVFIVVSDIARIQLLERAGFSVHINRADVISSRLNELVRVGPPARKVLKVWTGSAWKVGVLKVWNGSTWVIPNVRRWTGIDWA